MQLFHIFHDILLFLVCISVQKDALTPAPVWMWAEPHSLQLHLEVIVSFLHVWS